MKAGKIIAVYMVRLFMVQSAIVKSGFTTTVLKYDGIEDSITEELVASGVPKDRIVLAFHPREIREHTGYAVA